MSERTKAASRRIMHEMLPGDNYVIRIKDFPDYTRICEILYGIDTAIWQAEGNLKDGRMICCFSYSQLINRISE